VVRLARVSVRAGYESSPARRLRQSHSADSATCECAHHDNIYVKMITQGCIRTDLLSTVQGGGRDLKVATTNGGIELKKS
jgi:hypothetical protein